MLTRFCRSYAMDGPGIAHRHRAIAIDPWQYIIVILPAMASRAVRNARGQSYHTGVRSTGRVTNAAIPDGRGAVLEVAHEAAGPIYIEVSGEPRGKGRPRSRIVGD